MKQGFLTRMLVAVCVPAFVILIGIYEYLGGTGIECPFYKWTGFCCPGCGTGRAVQALFHGHIAEAVSYNILLPVLGLPCLFILVHEYLRIVFPGLKLRPVMLSQRMILSILVIVIAFWVLRNVPMFSFLAPGEPAAW